MASIGASGPNTSKLAFLLAITMALQLPDIYQLVWSRVLSSVILEFCKANQECSSIADYRDVRFYSYPMPAMLNASHYIVVPTILWLNRASTASTNCKE